MSIFTHTFPLYIKNQLNDRGNILAIGNKKNTSRTSKTKKYPAGAFFTNTIERQCVIRLCSGVDLNEIGEKNILKNKKERDNWVGVGLAKKWILEGGIPQENKNVLFPRSGFTGNNTAYGDPMTRSDAGDGFGIVPMPGIIDASIKVKSAYGSLREAKVNFVCHNIRQLEILEALYMRPGYNLLLEYGWTPYIKTGLKTNITTKDNEFPLLTEFFDGSKSISQLNEAILDRKIESGGNYDAHLGVCKNFEIKVREDGGYDCSTTIISMGEILEGLKGKRDFPPIQSDEDEDAKIYDNFEVYLMALQQKMKALGELKDFNDQSQIWKSIQTALGALGLPYGINHYSSEVANPFRHNISSEFKEAYESIFAKESSIQVYIQKHGKMNNDIPIQASEHESKVSTSSQLDGKVFGEFFQDAYLKQVAHSQTMGLMDSFLIQKGEVLGFGNMGDEALGVSQYDYIRWDFLAELLNEFIIEDATGTTDGSIKRKLVRLSYLDESEESPDDTGQYLAYTNFYFEDPNLTIPVDLRSIDEKGESGGSDKNIINVNMSTVLDGSMDPSICLFPHQITPNDPVKKPLGTLVLGRRENPTKINAHNRCIGLIYIGVDYLLNTYRNMRYSGNGKDNEDFSLLKFIQKIWEEDITGACANTHEFLFQMPNNVGRVIDMGYQGGLKKDDLYELKIQGNESIVRDFNFNTSIDKKLSSTISIAAQSPKNIKNIDQLSFAAFNKNIKNRFVETEKPDLDITEKSRIKQELDVLSLASQLYHYKESMISNSSVNNESGEENAKTGQTINVSNAIKKSQLLTSKIIQLGMTYPLKCPQVVNEKLKFDGCIDLQGKQHPARGQQRSDLTINRSSIIPLKFNAKMDGIGGIVIGNVFRLDPTRLPEGYKGDDVAFVVFGVNHKLTKGQDWTTELSGQLILLNSEEQTSLGKYDFKQIGDHLLGGQLYGKFATPFMNPKSGMIEYTRGPNALRVVRLLSNKYDEPHLKQSMALVKGASNSPTHPFDPIIVPGGDALDGFVYEKTKATTIDDPFPQLDSGGDLSEIWSKAFVQILTKIKEETDDPPGTWDDQQWTGSDWCTKFGVKPRAGAKTKDNPYRLKISGGNDLYHQQQAPNSFHTLGHASDFVVEGMENFTEIERILQKFVIANIYTKDGKTKSYFRYKNEYIGGISANPGNEHFHLMYCPTGDCSDGKKELDASEKLNNAGKLFNQKSGLMNLNDNPIMFELDAIKQEHGVYVLS